MSKHHTLFATPSLYVNVYEVGTVGLARELFVRELPDGGELEASVDVDGEVLVIRRRRGKALCIFLDALVDALLRDPEIYAALIAPRNGRGDS